MAVLRKYSMEKKIVWLLLFAPMLASTVVAKQEQDASTVGLRPFYIIGHGANSINEAARYLSLGANALEIDVNVYRNRPDDLCIGHGPVLGSGGCGNEAPALEDYLRSLHGMACTNQHFTLVYFDCKPRVATASHGLQLLDAIRTSLIGQGTNAVPLKVIVSVPHLKTCAAIFDRIETNLGPGEMLQVDQDRDVGQTASFFTGSNVTNQSLAYGTTVLNGWSGWRIRPVIETACAIRSTNTNVRLVITYTVNSSRQMRRYIRAGVDGILVDRIPPWGNGGQGLKGLRELLEAEGTKLGIRAASRDDGSN